MFVICLDAYDREMSKAKFKMTFSLICGICIFRMTLESFLWTSTQIQNLGKIGLSNENMSYPSNDRTLICYFTLIYFSSIVKQVMFAYVNHARIRS